MPDDIQPEDTQPKATPQPSPKERAIDVLCRCRAMGVSQATIYAEGCTDDEHAALVAAPDGDAVAVVMAAIEDRKNPPPKVKPTSNQKKESGE